MKGHLYECRQVQTRCRVTRRLRNKPRQPAELAADVVERVLTTDGDMYLETLQHALSWWQLSLIDVKAFLLTAALLVVGLTGSILYRVIVLLQRVDRTNIAIGSIANIICFDQVPGGV